MTAPIDSISVDVKDIEAEVRSGDLDRAAGVLAQDGHPFPHAAAGRAWAQERARAFVVNEPSPRPTWPPQPSKMLAPRGKLPEVTRDELDAQTLIDGVIGSGSLIVRGLLDPAEAESFRESIDFVMQARDSIRAGDDQAGNVAWFDRYPPAVLCSWGAFDHQQVRRDCDLHGLEYPFVEHANLRIEFARAMGCKPCGMSAALRRAGLPVAGTHHRGARRIRAGRRHLRTPAVS